MSAEDIFRIMAYDPISLEWKKDLEDKLRLTIQGDMEGYPVVMHVYDSDFLSADNNGLMINPFPYEVGIVQYISGIMQDHGLVAPFRKRSEDRTSESNTQRQGSWKCRYHGDSQLKKSNFGNGMQCSYREKAEGFKAPEWANSKSPKEYQGEHYWWCKEKE